MPQPADFPISLRRPKPDGSADHVYANSQQEWEGLQSAGFTQEGIKVEWPKLLRHPNGDEVTVANETELKARRKDGYGFPRDIPQPPPKEETKMVSVAEVQAMQRDFQREMAMLQVKLEMLAKAPQPSPSEKK